MLGNMSCKWYDPTTLYAIMLSCYVKKLKALTYYTRLLLRNVGSWYKIHNKCPNKFLYSFYNIVKLSKNKGV